MRYAYTIFYVTEVERTINFYQNAFGFQQKFITPQKDYGELISGETTIAFASLDLGKSNFAKAEDFDKKDLEKKNLGMEMAFVTENIETDFRKAIEAGAEKYIEIVEKPWGQKVGYLRDPNGILLEICTPIKK